MNRLKLLTIISILVSNLAFGQEKTPITSSDVKVSSQELIHQFKEKGSNILEEAGNWFYEEVNKTCIYKEFHPEKKVLTKVYHFKNRRKKVRHGKSTDFYDHGGLRLSYTFSNNVLQGEFISIGLGGSTTRGDYLDGERHGVWTTHYKNGMLTIEENYAHGLLHGEYVRYDTLGNLKEKLIYDEGLLIEGEKSLAIVSEQPPRFPGCEDESTVEEKEVCAQKKMLKYVYENINYPKSAMDSNVSGMAIISFVIDKSGEVTNIQCINGLCDAIEAECINLVSNMPNFIPGVQNGNKVKVEYRLPIKFKLE